MNHIFSLLLGLLAWGLGIRAAVRGRPGSGSFAACALSLLLQLVELRRLAQQGDTSAIYDTIGAVTLAAAVLLAVTAALNGIALLRRYRKTQ